MKICIASDHAGLDLKLALIPYLREELGCEVEDIGTHSTESCDYPGYAVPVAEAAAAGEVDLGILICGTGVGMSVAANKVLGAVAALCGDTYTARMARAHNDANVLCLGGRVIGIEIARDIAREFVSGSPDEGERYVRRRHQVAQIPASRGRRD